MIIFGENSKHENVLHLIIGPETETQFNFSGQSVVDITDYMKNMNPDKPCRLILNRCDSEQELLQIISMQEGQNRIQNAMKKVQRQLLKQENQKPSKRLKNQSAKVKCPKCGTEGVSSIQNGQVMPCKTCQEIDEGLRAKEIPPDPSEDELKLIQEDIEKKYPEQKSSIQRFLRDDIPEEFDDDYLDESE